jgi:hypothetical protein
MPVLMRTPEEQAEAFCNAIRDGATVMAHPDTLRDAPRQFMDAGMSAEAVLILFAKTMPHPYLKPGELYAVRIPTPEDTVNMLTVRFEKRLFVDRWIGPYAIS